MELDAVAVFVKVAQLGGFSKAAKALGMPNSTVSAKVAQLEKDLGVTLLQRTTRKLHVTEAGEAFFRRCVHALDELESARKDVTLDAKAPQGKLKITAPVDVGHWILPQLLRRFVDRHPQVQIDLLITNRRVDLIGEGVDVAIRMGDLEDSTLMARRFVIGASGFWATPSYMKGKKVPSRPQELADHSNLVFSPFRGRKLVLTNGKETSPLTLQGRIAADDFESLKMLALQDLGVAMLPTFLCDEDAAKGKLMRLLPQWTLPIPDCSFVYPAQRFVPPKIRAFIDLAEETWGKA